MKEFDSGASHGFLLNNRNLIDDADKVTRVTIKKRKNSSASHLRHRHSLLPDNRNLTGDRVAEDSRISSRFDNEDRRRSVGAEREREREREIPVDSPRGNETRQVVGRPYAATSMHLNWLRPHSSCSGSLPPLIASWEVVSRSSRLFFFFFLHLPSNTISLLVSSFHSPTNVVATDETTLLVIASCSVRRFSDRENETIEEH